MILKHMLKKRYCLNCHKLISKFSDKTTKRCVACARKHNIYWLGKHHTNETKMKISKNRTGKLMGNGNPSKRLDVRRKISKALKGRKFPLWLRKKFSQAHKGKILTEIHRKHIGNAPHKHHIDGNHNNNRKDNIIILQSNSLHQQIYKIYYKFIKIQKMNRKFKKWLFKNYSIKGEKYGRKTKI